MKILSTNDDGFDAVGIRLLAEWAQKLGDVTVIAPKTEQSGKSHGIDFINPAEIKKVDIIDGITVYSMDSTPAECVRFGVYGLKEKYDLVLSGINRGVNVGEDIVYSGTVGAIFEAAKCGIPAAIAFSTFPDTQQIAAGYLDAVYEYICENKLLEENNLYNVNIPDKVDGIRMTYQGSMYYSDDFIRREGDIYIQVGGPVPDIEPDNLDRDTVAIHKNLITVTPLLFTRTNMEVFHKFATKEN